MAVKIIAHRGDTRNNPENTLAAFRAALDAGADAIELDVHSTRDGHLIVHHDYYLGNPDNGEGKIHEKNLAYIQDLAIGENEHIPTLEEIFRAFGDRLEYEIELKGFGEAFLLAVVALIKKHNLTDHVELTSPHAYTLTFLKKLDLHLKTGRFIAPLPGWMDKELGQSLAINDATLGDVNVLHCPIELIDRQFVQDAHSKSLLVHAADCDTDEVLQTVLDAKVDQLSTNNLERALRHTANRPPF